MASIPAIVHTGFICDECGANPIIGTRFVATDRFHYDICSSCHHEQSFADKTLFVAFDEPKGNKAYDVCTVNGNQVLGPVYFNVKQAAERLGQNDGIRHAHICLAGNSAAPFKEEDGTSLRNAIRSYDHLQSIQFHMCDGLFNNQLVIDIAHGITENKFIRRVEWHLGATNRSIEAAEAIRNMIVANNNLEYVSISKVCDDSTTKPSGVGAINDNKFARCIFEGLTSNSSLKILFVGSCNTLSEETKDCLLEIVKQNESIQRIKANFEKSDHRLDLLLSFNREKWIKKLTQATSLKRKRIFFEAIDHPDSSKEPVATAYQLMRSFPDLFN